MIRRLLLVLLLLMPVPAAAQATLAGRLLEGSWALRAEGAIIMRFDLRREGEAWAGDWEKPTSFRSDGVRFGMILMPAVERTADRGQAIGEWAEITFDDPRPNEPPDQFRFRLISPDRAEMLYVGTGLPPFVLERVATDAALGPFAEGRVYGAAPAVVRPAAAPAPAVGPPAPSATPEVRPVPVAPTPAPAPQRPPPPAPPPQTPPPEEEPPVQGPPVMIGR